MLVTPLRQGLITAPPTALIASQANLSVVIVANALVLGSACACVDPYVWQIPAPAAALLLPRVRPLVLASRWCAAGAMAA